MTNENRPEPGKQYALTGAKGDKCIMNGHNWKESEIKQGHKIEDVTPAGYGPNE